MQPERKCRNCGDAVPIGGRGRPRVFCSQKCRTVYEATDEFKQAESARKKTYVVDVVCVDCGKTRPMRPKTNLPERCRECAYKHRHPTFPVEIPGLIPIYDEHGACDFARVDIEDWERFKHERFSFTARRYPAKNGAAFGGKTEYLHRMILGLEAGVRRKHEQTDHINRDPTDNRRSNLRVVTAKENCGNRGGVFERAA